MHPRLLMLIGSLLGLLITLPLTPNLVIAQNAYPFNPLEWHLTAVNAPFAWSHTADGHGVTVLVVDTGLDSVIASTAMSGTVAPSMSVNPLHDPVPVACADGVPSVYQTCTQIVKIPNPNAYLDLVGHGTFVACEIACNGGVDAYYGIAPKARVAMAKVSLGENISTQDVATAIRWGAIHRYRIISLSLGGIIDQSSLRNAVQFAESQGCILVASSGNDGLPESMYPSSYPGVVRVGATDRWGRLAFFSNTTGISLTAPGFYVYGLAPMTPNVIAAGGLVTLSGTSMSAPLAAGALADLLSWGLTSKEAVQALLDGATWSPHTMQHSSFGHGMLNLEGSLWYAISHGWK